MGIAGPDISTGVLSSLFHLNPGADPGDVAAFNRHMTEAPKTSTPPVRDEFTKFVDSTGIFGQAVKTAAGSVLKAGNSFTTGLVQFGASAVSSLPPELSKLFVGANAYRTDNKTPTVGQFLTASA